MASTLISFSQDQEPKTITFVGRLKSFRKGLTTLFEAIAILNSVNKLPHFRLNIVGGNKDDVKNLKFIITRLPHLSTMYSNGLIIIWGYVESQGLAEIYSRSLVTVVPSLFEQFGLIAAEAMACGCPVLAADVGGLKDSVIPGVTGKLFKAGDSLHLAALLSGYLRGTHIASFEGCNAVIWAKNRFSINMIYSALNKVIREENISNEELIPLREFHSILLNNLTHGIEKELDQKILDKKNLSGNSQISYYIRTKEQEYYMKYFHDRPSAACLYLYCPDNILLASRRVSNIRKSITLSASSFSPNLIKTVERKGFILFEWIESSSENSINGLEDLMPVLLDIQNFGKKILKKEYSDKFINGLKEVEASPNIEGIRLFYDSAALVNSLLEGEYPTYLDSHPQVELLNIKLTIEDNLYPLPENERTRFLLLTNLILSSFPLVITTPILTHGDIKPEHFLYTKDGIKLCDWETTGFRCGPYDIASWYFKNEMGRKLGSVQEIMDKAKEWLKNEEEMILMLCWIASMACHEFLTRYLRGQNYNVLRHSIIFNSLPEAITNLSNQLSFNKTVIQ